MKKLGKSLLILILLLGSMYITNIMIELTREKDPIMVQIMESREKYETKPVDAIVEKDNIIPGEYGIEVNLQDSYSHMKKYGSYNESLTVLNASKPDISVEDNYGFYIAKGNSGKREVSLVFPVDEKENLSKVLKILEKNEVEATLFLEGSILEKTSSLLKNNLKHEYEILSFNGKYTSSFLNSSASYLESITKKKTKYCYTEKANSALLKFGIKEEKHTIKPKYIYKENLYKDVKNDLENGMIISININEDTIRELETTIEYIKSKGYLIVTLEKLLMEQQEKE